MLSIVVPTYNEKDGIPVLVREVFSVLRAASIEGEMVIVDDNSPDGTGQVAEELGREYPVQVVHRAGKLGLSSAVIDGFKVAKGDILGVMDADFSHDPKILPAMVKAVTEEGCEFVVGSRYIPGGGVKDWPFVRLFISKFAVMLARPLTPIRDITSGYFIFRKEIIEGVTLNPIGFKICLEIAIKGRYNAWKEVPYTFINRVAGTSKMSRKEVVNYLVQLVDLWKFKTRRRQSA